MNLILWGDKMAKKENFKGIVKSIHIDSFRKIHNLDFELGPKVTAIAGQNGSMKTTILGMLGQPFSWRDKENPMCSANTIDGYSFESKLSDKFKFSEEFDVPGTHKWKLNFTNSNICEDGCFELKSEARPDSGIRFWSTKGRSKGDGYITLPVLYLSLKRLIPVGEEKKATFNTSSLSPAEQDIYKKYYTDILVLSEEITSIDHIKSSNKSSLAPTTSKYDSKTISAGQDNIGKILLSVLSFARLKDTYPDTYKGGILLIDEIDATLFPKAQEKLVESLFYFSSKFNIQIIFTTHSFSVIKTMFLSKYINDGKLIYLRSQGDNVTKVENVNFDQIESNLSITALKPVKSANNKIRIYCEDTEARMMIKSILYKPYLSLVKFVNVKMGGDSLISLCCNAKVPEFTSNLIILDADKSVSARNILNLPGDGMPPDQILYYFLKSLPDSHEFWPGATQMGLYDKQMCFCDHMNLDRNERGVRIKFKEWFNRENENFGRNCEGAFKYWKLQHQEEVAKFNSDFVKAYNYVAKKHSLPLI